MKKTHLLFVLFLLFGASAFAQSGETQLPGHDQTVQQAPKLKTLAAQLVQAQQDVQMAATGSRATGVEAQDKLRASMDAYLAALQEQLNAQPEADLKKAIESEIALVKKQQASR